MHSNVVERSRACSDVCAYSGEIRKEEKAILLLGVTFAKSLKHSCQTSVWRRPFALSDA